eukprot:UN02392
MIFKPKIILLSLLSLLVLMIMVFPTVLVDLNLVKMKIHLVLVVVSLHLLLERRKLNRRHFLILLHMISRALVFLNRKQTVNLYLHFLVINVKSRKKLSGNHFFQKKAEGNLLKDR